MKVQQRIYPRDQVKLVAHFQRKPTLENLFFNQRNRDRLPDSSYLKYAQIGPDNCW